MLPDRRVHTTLPVSDLDRTRRFYEDTLGFKPIEGNPAAILYRAGEGTVFAITRSSGKAAGTHTQMGSQSRTSPGRWPTSRVAGSYSRSTTLRASRRWTAWPRRAPGTPPG